MIKQTIFILACFPVLLFGQFKKLELGFSIGNNGQLDNTLNDFYTINYYNGIILNNYDANETSIKYSASVRYFFTDNLSARIKFGKAIRKGYNAQNSTNQYWDFDVHQSITNISPSACFSKRINKIELMTGLEIPLINVGDYIVKRDNRHTPNNGNGTSGKSTATTAGGFIWGINNFIGAKYYFTNRFCVGTEINYGLLFADIGGTYKVEYEQGSTHPINSYTAGKKLKNNFFSTPEISIGLFILLGRNKDQT